MYYYDNYLSNNNSENGLLEYDGKNYIVNNKIIENNRGLVNDIVFIDENKVINIKQRSKQNISGILYMNSNKSYGRNKKGMNYYKFKALNNKFKSFLVPCSLKIKRKVYIVIEFNKWDITDKYPIGICKNIIGEIGEQNNEYEILLHKYDLKYPKLKIHKNIINNDLNQKIDNIDYNIFTIDPINCKDIDDGISIKKDKDIIEIGVHITDVSYYMNDKLFDIFKGLNTSIYYNNRQINMLPEVYSTNICSLLENTSRKCISIIYKYKDSELIAYEIKESNVYVEKNFSYDEAEEIIVKKDKKYKDLLELWDNMIKIDNNIIDTHKLIEYLMIKSNQLVGETLYKYDKNGSILRTHKIKSDYSEEEKVSDVLNNYLKLKTYESAKYEINSDNIYHAGLELEFYTHYTSPIRRVVDIINHINIKKYLNNEKLINIETDIIDNINNQNKRIIKLRNDNKILDLFYKINNKEYKTNGYILDIDEKKIVFYLEEFDLEYKYILKDNSNKDYKKYMNIEIMLYFIKEGEKLNDKVLVKIIE